MLKPHKTMLVCSHAVFQALLYANIVSHALCFHFTDKRDHHDDESGIGPSIYTDTESITSSRVSHYFFCL